MRVKVTTKVPNMICKRTLNNTDKYIIDLPVVNYNVQAILKTKKLVYVKTFTINIRLLENMLMR